MAQTESKSTDTCCSPCDPFSMVSCMRWLLPPQENMVEFERHFIRSQVELLKGIRSLVDGYLSRMESCDPGKTDRPERMSKIEIEEEKEEN